MTKKIIFGLAVTALFASCTEDFKDWANPQKNEQQPLEISFSVEQQSPVVISSSATTVDMNYKFTTDKQGTTTLSSVTLYNESGESYVVEAESEGKVNAKTLDYAVRELYGWEHVARAMKSDVVATFDADEIIKLNADDVTTTVTPIDPGTTSNFYVIGGLPGCAWEPASTAVPMTASGTVFTKTFENLTAGNEYWFAFSDDLTVSSNDWSNVIANRIGNGENLVGSVGFFDRRGNLNSDKVGDGSFKIIPTSTKIKITIDFAKGTYLIENI